jgi:hypothetical protein
MRTLSFLTRIFLQVFVLAAIASCDGGGGGGLAWTLIPSPDCGNDVLWDGLRYVSVGGSICRSP